MLVSVVSEKGTVYAFGCKYDHVFSKSLYTLGLAMDIIVSGYVLHSGVKNGWQLLTKK